MIAFVPARRGSQQLPGKNTRPFRGRPLITHTLDAIAAAGCIAETWVSTDDPDVVQLARDAGLRVHARPDPLAGATALITDVIRAFLTEHTRDVHDDDAIVLLQATSPLRQARHIREAVGRFRGNPAAQSLVSVTDFEWPPDFALQMRGVFVEAVNPDAFRGGRVRRSDARVLHRPNGAVYIGLAGNLRRGGSFYAPPILAYLMSSNVSIDIDSREDFDLAEALMGLGEAHRD